MISLLYKIFGDNSPFRKTVTKDMPADAAKGGTESGKFFGAQFKGAVLKYIGLSAILAEFTKLATEAANIIKEATKEGVGVEAFQELQKAAELTGLSLEELKKKAIEAPAEFARLMESIRAGGGIMSKEDVENLAEAGRAMKEMEGSAAKIFGWLWKAGKTLATVASALGLEAASTVARQLGSITGFFGGGEDLRTWGKTQHIAADLGFEDAAALWSGEKAPSKAPAAEFVAAAKRREELEKHVTDAMGGLLSLGGVLDPYAASKAGIIPKPKDDSIATMADAVKAIKELNATVDKKL